MAITLDYGTMVEAKGLVEGEVTMKTGGRRRTMTKSRSTRNWTPPTTCRVSDAAAPLIALAGADLHQRNTVLSGVDLEARAGEFIYLIGRTGSGKSSLLKTLYGELSPWEADRLWRGPHHAPPQTGSPPPAKAGHRVPDFELLTDRTADENLQFVLKVTDWKDAGDRERRIAEVMQAVGLENKGYKRPHELSGGERQRLAIARALLNAPDLILADEPTGNLDPQTAEGILQLLHDLAAEGRCPHGHSQSRHPAPQAGSHPAMRQRQVDGTPGPARPHMMDAGRPSLCLAIPLLDDRESDALARTLDSIVAAGFTASPEILIRVADDRDAYLTCSTTCSPTWSFQPDGIYAAMNALLHRATSDLILCVGAGDLILPAAAPTGGQPRRCAGHHSTGG